MIKIKGFTLFITFSLIFTSCFTGFFAETEESIEGIERQHYTTVQFNNSTTGNSGHKILKVKVFSDLARNNPMGEAVPPRTTSDIVDCTPSSMHDFYFTFYLNINGVEIPFSPPSDKGGFHSYPVKRNDNTVVPIPPISERNPNANEILVTDALFLVIRNLSSSTIDLSTGSSGMHTTQTTVDGMQYILANQSGTYRLTTTNISNYVVMINYITPVPLPITTVERGKFYIFNFNGSTLTLSDEKNIAWGNSL